MRRIGLLARAGIAIGIAASFVVLPAVTANAQDISETKCLDFYPSELLFPPNNPQDPGPPPPDRCVIVFYGENPPFSPGYRAEGTGAFVYAPTERGHGPQISTGSNNSGQWAWAFAATPGWLPFLGAGVSYLRWENSWQLGGYALYAGSVAGLPIVVGPSVEQTKDGSGATHTTAQAAPWVGVVNAGSTDGTCMVTLGGGPLTGCPDGLAVPWLQLPVVPLPVLP
ncbi:MAG: hypothetical protein QOF21_1179 [Actinomycetota bacterium]|jgi:hypothetical protein